MRLAILQSGCIAVLIACYLAVLLSGYRLWLYWFNAVLLSPTNAVLLLCSVPCGAVLYFYVMFCVVLLCAVLGRAVLYCAVT